MEHLIILAGGLAGGLSALKKNFISVWVFYFNTIFAAVPALGLTQLVASLLDLPFLPVKLRAITAFLLLFIVFMTVLNKIMEQVMSNTETPENFPAAPGVILGMCAGFITGCFYGAMVVLLLGFMPFMNGIISNKKFKSTGLNRIHLIAYTAALQSAPDRKTQLNCFRISDPDRKKKASGKDSGKDDSGKDDSGKDSGKDSGQKDQSSEKEQSQTASQTGTADPESQVREKDPAQSVTPEKKKKRSGKKKKRKQGKSAQRTSNQLRQHSVSETFYAEK